MPHSLAFHVKSIDALLLDPFIDMPRLLCGNEPIRTRRYNASRREVLGDQVDRFCRVRVRSIRTR
jgi:hypothetical protein